MQWIKLDINFDLDEKMVEVERVFGLEGQMRIVKVWCTIARQMKFSNRAWVIYSAGFWTRELKFRSYSGCKSFLETVSKIGLIEFEANPPKSLFDYPQPVDNPVDNSALRKRCIESFAERSRNDWLVKCDKLLKRRDPKVVDKIKNKNIYSHPLKGVEENTPKTTAEWKQDWAKIKEHVSRKGTGTPIEGLSEKGKLALKKIGGLFYVGQTESSQMKFLGYEFRDVYDETMDSPKSPHKNEEGLR